ncbi:MAG: hypothetical protein A2V64_08505 [Bacteroidetes bacterium RBG_13_43_22]|nr:MAG: hypothetical protein A2V64_08505 [Bacteroidetes bacterium RBG_13_43_22]
MKSRYLIILIVSISLIAGCITQFIPETDEATNLLVVEGKITDQYRINKIKISRSLPLGKYVSPKPLKGCKVTISDENNLAYNLKEFPTGTYSTDSTTFRGHVGGKYTLRIVTGNLTYVSSQMEMLPVPPVDSLFYEKVLITEANEFGNPEEGCRIFLNTFDPEQKCLFFRWEFTETWQFRLPFSVPNSTCWITQSSGQIHIKNTSVYGQSRVTRYPLIYITNETDRLKLKYSILVRQYSLNQDEYNYWEKLQNVYGNVGGLYDVTPMAISSNIHNQNDPDEMVLGYFSVSAMSEKRLFIKERFDGMPSLYNNCIGDTIFGGSNVHIEGLNAYVWVIEDQSFSFTNPYRVITYNKECADCTTRGTATRPSFWID